MPPSRDDSFGDTFNSPYLNGIENIHLDNSFNIAATPPHKRLLNNTKPHHININDNNNPPWLAADLGNLDELLPAWDQSQGTLRLDL